MKRANATTQNKYELDVHAHVHDYVDAPRVCYTLFMLQFIADNSHGDQTLMLWANDDKRCIYRLFSIRPRIILLCVIVCSSLSLSLDNAPIVDSVTNRRPTQTKKCVRQMLLVGGIRVSGFRV